MLLDNPYVFADFWKFQNGSLPEAAWKASFAAANKAAHVALGRQDTVTVLSIVLSRIYTLRNQLVHGGATWNGSVNREQMRDCVEPDGEAGAAGDRGDDGSPGDVVGGCVLSGREVRGRRIVRGE